MYGRRGIKGEEMVGIAHVETVGTSAPVDSLAPAVILNKQIEFPLLVPVCAWCKPSLKRNPDARDISHGICPRHLKAMRLQIQGAPTPRLTHRRVRRADNTALLSF